MNITKQMDFKNITKSKGGMFNVTDSNLEKNIGKQCSYINKDHKKNGMISLLPFRIVGIQRIYDGSIAYRIEECFKDNCFGRPVSENEITINDTELTIIDTINYLRKEQKNPKYSLGQKDCIKSFLKRLQ